MFRKRHYTMKFIPKKTVNRLVPFSFYKTLQNRMSEFVLTNSAFSSVYLAPHSIPKNSKAQKRLFKKYDAVDENMQAYRKDNFLEIEDETYLIISTVVRRSQLIAYTKDKSQTDIRFEMSNPGQLLLQVCVDGHNILTPQLSQHDIDQMDELSLDDDRVKVFVNIANTSTYDMDLIQIK